MDKLSNEICHAGVAYNMYNSNEHEYYTNGEIVYNPVDNVNDNTPSYTAGFDFSSFPIKTGAMPKSYINYDSIICFCIG